MADIIDQINSLQGTGEAQPGVVISTGEAGEDTPRAVEKEAAPAGEQGEQGEQKDEKPAGESEQKPPAAAGEDADAIDRYIRGEADQQEEPWADDAVARFEKEFGAKPTDFRGQYQKEKVELESLRPVADRMRKIEETMGKLPVEMEEALRLAMDGGDPVAYLKSISDVRANMPAKDVDKYSLVKHYFGKEWTQEQLDEVRTGVADDKTVALFERTHGLAAHMHDEKYNTNASRLQQRAQEVQARTEALRSSAINAVAEFKKDPVLSSLVDGAIVDEFLSGKLESRLLRNEDGSYKPDALRRLVMPEFHVAIMERVRKGAIKAGHEEGRLSERGKQHDTAPPAPGTRTRLKAGNEQTPEQTVGAEIDKVVQSVR